MRNRGLDGFWPVYGRPKLLVECLEELWGGVHLGKVEVQDA